MPILDHVKIAQKLRELGFEPVEGSFLGEGEANIGTNVGDGTGLVYRDKTGVTLNFRTLKEDPANPGMIITVDGDTILLGTPAGTGNVVGSPPSEPDGVATYDGVTGLLIDGPDTKLLTAIEELSETAPKDRPVQYMLMKTSDGTAWAEIIRYGISAAGSFDNNIRIGPIAQFSGQDNTITLVATKDPLVTILNASPGTGKVIHENLQEIWEIRKEGTISQLIGADTAILSLFNRNATTYTEVKFKAGNITPEGNINGANGDRYYFKDQADASNSTEYIFRNLTPGLSGWVELGGGGGVTDHGALTGLADDDHTQYALLAGRTGGQELVGGDGGTDSLELKATSGTGASGSNVDLLVGNDGDTLALRAQYNGNVGVGTTAPASKLSVAGGDFRVESTLPLFIFGDTSGGGWEFRFAVSGNRFYIRNQTYGASVFNIVSNRVGIGVAAPLEALHVSGSIRMADGFEGIGRVSTCEDADGTQKWLNPNPVLERTSNYTATVLDRTIVCEDILTITLPDSGIEDGHVFKIKNAVGVTYGSGDTSDVTVSITGSTVKFDKTSGNSKTLTADGWVLVCQWSSSASTYWITQFSLETTTGSPV